MDDAMSAMSAMSAMTIEWPVNEETLADSDVEVITEEPIAEPTPRKELTILLLGETGVGKSTFINAFANYMLFEKLDDAAKDIRCLIPTQFTVYDSRARKSKKVILKCEDENENTGGTASATKGPKCHKFESDNLTINIIDTPGIGDTHGCQYDRQNMQSLLRFIGQYEEINAICVLLKPNNARVTVVFQYCIFELLKFLNKSAANNIVFLFTNARSTFYRPGDTGPALDELLQRIKDSPPNVDIVFDDETTFCFDNEAFRYLVAVSEPNCIEFTDEIKKDYEKSWETSFKECERFFSYIAKLPPHKVKDTVSVNNARSKILLLTKPLADIGKNVSDNIKRCGEQRENLMKCQNDIKELKRNLFIPIVVIESIPLPGPMTVCGDDKCCEKKNINGQIKVHYKTICHQPCGLNLNANVMGEIGLLNCWAFLGNSEICIKCRHSYQTHLHIRYSTQLIEKKVMDESKSNRIKTQEEAVIAKTIKIQELEKRIDELKVESSIITNTSAAFAIFLKENAIVSLNDVFEEYIEYMIEQGKMDRALGYDQDNVKMFEKMLEEYKQEKMVIESADGKAIASADITAERVDQYFQELFALKHSGPTIKDHLEMQQKIDKNVHNHHYQVTHKMGKGARNLLTKVKDVMALGYAFLKRS